MNSSGAEVAQKMTPDQEIQKHQPPQADTIHRMVLGDRRVTAGLVLSNLTDILVMRLLTLNHCTTLNLNQSFKASNENTGSQRPKDIHTNVFLSKVTAF